MTRSEAKRASKAKVKATFGGHVTPCVSYCLSVMGIERSAYRVACTPSDILRIAGRHGYSLRRHTSWAGKTVGKLRAALKSGREDSAWLVFVEQHVLMLSKDSTWDTDPRQRDRRKIIGAWRVTRKAR